MRESTCCRSLIWLTQRSSIIEIIPMENMAIDNQCHCLVIFQTAWSTVDFSFIAHTSTDALSWQKPALSGLIIVSPQCRRIHDENMASKRPVDIVASKSESVF